MRDFFHFPAATSSGASWSCFLRPRKKVVFSAQRGRASSGGRQRGRGASGPATCTGRGRRFRHGPRGRRLQRAQPRCQRAWPRTPGHGDVRIRDLAAAVRECCLQGCRRNLCDVRFEHSLKKIEKSGMSKHAGSQLIKTCHLSIAPSRFVSIPIDNLSHPLIRDDDRILMKNSNIITHTFSQN